MTPYHDIVNMHQLKKGWLQAVSGLRLEANQQQQQGTPGLEDSASQDQIFLLC